MTKKYFIIHLVDGQTKAITIDNNREVKVYTNLSPASTKRAYYLLGQNIETAKIKEDGAVKTISFSSDI